MEYNFKMQRVLNRVYRAGVSPVCEYKVWEKKTLDGDRFYGIGNFCGIATDNIIQYGKELTRLEWDGNELFFSNESVEELEKQSIAAYLAIKEQLEKDFSQVKFDIVVSIDEEAKTGTIRFYMIREEFHYIEPTHKNLAQFEMEAILVDTVNAIHLKDYIPILVERFAAYNCEIIMSDKKEMQIVNPYCDKHIWVDWNNDEFTMYFSSSHEHYGEDEFEEMVEVIENILSGEFVDIYVTCEERWMQSRITAKNEIPLDSEANLMKYLFIKEAYRKVKEKGAVVEVTGWNPKENTKILL